MGTISDFFFLFKECDSELTCPLTSHIYTWMGVTLVRHVTVVVFGSESLIQLWDFSIPRTQKG